jgi:hypothetical protein
LEEENKLYKHWKESDKKDFSTVKAFLDKESDGVCSDVVFDKAALRKFLVDLQTKPNWYKKRIVGDFFNHCPEIVDYCEDKYLKPTIECFFRKLIESKQKTLKELDQGDVDLDEAISEFVKAGKFKEEINQFCENEDLNHIDLDFCSKLFYKVFKQHFDTRKGSGVMEMINVGKKHPEELEKMMLMKEYDDIRARLLKLQLTGEIDSLNYQ